MFIHSPELIRAETDYRREQLMWASRPSRRQRRRREDAAGHHPDPRPARDALHAPTAEPAPTAPPPETAAAVREPVTTV